MGSPHAGRLQASFKVGSPPSDSVLAFGDVCPVSGCVYLKFVECAGRLRLKC
jgi:hypothetical protein